MASKSRPNGEKHFKKANLNLIVISVSSAKYLSNSVCFSTNNLSPFITYPLILTTDNQFHFNKLYHIKWMTISKRLAQEAANIGDFLGALNKLANGALDTEGKS